MVYKYNAKKVENKAELFGALYYVGDSLGLKESTIVVPTSIRDASLVNEIINVFNYIGIYSASFNGEEFVLLPLNKNSNSRFFKRLG